MSENQTSSDTPEPELGEQDPGQGTSCDGSRPVGTPVAEWFRAVAKARLESEIGAKHFMKNPDFASRQVALTEDFRQAEEKMQERVRTLSDGGRLNWNNDEQAYGSPARLAYVLYLLDRRALAYLKMVRDLEDHSAYVRVLRWLLFLAWDDLGGIDGRPGEGAMSQWIFLQRRVAHWEHEAMTQLVEDKMHSEAPGEMNATRDRIERFIHRVSKETGQKITRANIWRVAEYTEATQFLEFQREDPRCSSTARRNFNRVIGKSSSEFIEDLARRIARGQPNGARSDKNIKK